MFRTTLLAGATLLVAAGSAFAADLPSRAAPPVFVPPVPIFTWTGFYVGGHVGYQFGRDSASYSPGLAGVGVLPYAYNPNGVIGGAHVGYNYQVSQFVFGLEGDVDGSNFRRTFVPFPGGAYTTRDPIQGSVRGRVGVALDRVLLYATGGAAFGDFRTSYANNLGAFDSFSRSRVGWTVGAGAEYAITNNWSVRGEYRYTDYGRITDLPINNFGPGIAVRHHETDNRVLIGFSYKFDTFAPPGPVVAKY